MVQVEKSVARDRGGIYLWDPKPPRVVWFGFPALWDNVPATFLFYPIAPILPKDLQAPPRRAKMRAVRFEQPMAILEVRR